MCKHFAGAIFRGVAKLGIALGSGPRGPGFESRHSDHGIAITGFEMNSVIAFFFIAFSYVILTLRILPPMKKRPELFGRANNRLSDAIRRLYPSYSADR